MTTEKKLETIITEKETSDKLKQPKRRKSGLNNSNSSLSLGPNLKAPTQLHYQNFVMNARPFSGFNR